MRRHMTTTQSRNSRTMTQVSVHGKENPYLSHHDAERKHAIMPLLNQKRVMSTGKYISLTAASQVDEGTET